MAGARRRFGPVTVLIHAAGRNDPVDLLSLTREGYEAVVAPKTQGLAHALEAAGSSLSRAYVFGSIIGVIGLNGEAHYALANAMQSQILGAWTADHPAAVGLSIDWSVWGSVGMGERLGVLEGLARQGVEALSIDDALRAFESLVARNAFGSCVVTSRFGPPPQLGIGDTSLPSLRFVDEPVVHFPEVELVCETTISPGRDPYLADHRVEGRMILPGVMALEAMAQVASALSRGDTDVRRIAEVGYEQPISLPEQGGLRIRIAGLVLADGRVECCIRSEEDAFVAVRARATFGAPRRRLTRIDRKLTPRNDCDAASLYGPLFFHGERFHRISQILEISSRTVTARLSTGGGSWFATVEPQTLILGDPAVRDAALHVLQAAVLHRRVVPTGVSYIERREGGRAAVVRAHEVCATPGRYAFDIEIEDDDGVLIERWSRAVFRAIGPLDVPPVLRATPQLMGAYLERLAREVLLQDDLCAAAVLGEAPARRGGDDRRDARLGLGPVHRRADGKPSLGGSRDLTLAHAGLVSLAVQGEHRVGCDLTSIAAFLDPNRRPDMGAWPVENATGSDEATHAARVWAIGETLRKLGRRRASALASHTPEAPLPPGAAVHQDEDGALVLTVPLAAPGGDLMAAIGIEAAQTSRGRARQRVIHA